ncbi:MAG: transposase [Tissierellia bacterium]|nr:transposase [Tissierellia bacterium]
MDKTTPEKAMKELTMILMYLSRFNEDDRFSSSMDMSWKGYDFGIINKLDEDDYIRQGSYRSKSVAITDEGIKLARDLLNKYNIKDWE